MPDGHAAHRTTRRLPETTARPGGRARRALARLMRGRGPARWVRGGGLAVSVLCVAAAPGQAAAAPAASGSASASAVSAVQTVADGVIIHPTSGGTERIQVCGDRILRVSYVAQGDLPAKQSLIVTAVWPAHPHFVVRPDGADGVVVATADVQARVDLATGLIAYTDAHGTPLTSERAKTFGPSPSSAPGAEQEVSTVFNSPPDEGLFGLGQHQDGVMDDKGHEVTLDQFNNGGVGGEVALPVLVSSRGYGLMWDTYSRADFYGDLDGNTAYGFNAESDDMADYYFMYGPGIGQVVGDYRTATGQAPIGRLLP
jgi:galactose mutarotase-like protein